MSMRKTQVQSMVNEWNGEKLSGNDKVILDPPEVNTDAELGGALCRSKVREFFSSEWSVAGLKYVVVSGASKPRRLIWLTLVLFGAGFMIFQVQERIRYFLSNPTSVDIKANYRSEITFPTVTICNENIVDLSRAVDVNNFNLIIQAAYPPYPDPDFVPYFSNDTKAAFDAETDWEGKWQYMSPSYDKETIDGCTYNQVRCPMENVNYVATSMGYCLQFNGVGQNYTSNRSGSVYGLWLRLFANQPQYLYTKSLSAGFKILLHSKEDKPFVFDLGFKAALGVVTSVAINMKTIKQLPEPYGNCTDASGYLYKECVDNCLHDYVNRTCGCRYYYYNASTDSNACDPEEMYNCADGAASTFISEQLLDQLCTCPPQCHTDHYQYTLSSSSLSEYAITTIAEVLCKGDGLNCTGDQQLLDSYKTVISRDYGELEIYFDELIHEQVTTVPAYNLLALLCDIGGALGLILGSTVLTLFELFDFLCLIVYTSVCASVNRVKSKNDVRPTVLRN